MTQYSSYSNVANAIISTLHTGLIAYWKLNESSGNAADVKGVYTLTNNNTATYEAGKINNAVSLGASNTNKFLNCNNTFGMTYVSTRSMSGWFNIINIPAGTGNFTFVLASIMFATNPGNNSSFVYRRVTNVLKLTIISTDYNVILTPGTWYHMVITWDHAGNVSKLYLNSILRITSTSFTGNYSLQTNRLVIGQSAGASFSSSITDEFGLWNKILSQEEVDELYNAGNGVSYPF